MKRLSVCVLAICCVAGLLAGISPLSRAGDDDTKKKLEQIRKELDDLTNKEKELSKQRDDVIRKEKELEKQRADLQKQIDDLQREAHRRAEELRIQKAIAKKKFDEADKKAHYVKVELRGKLISSKTSPLPIHTGLLFVLTNETIWPLQLSDAKKELRDAALKLLDEPVVVTGTISTLRRKQPYAYPIFPEDQITGPFPRPGGEPMIRPALPYGLYSLEVQLPVTVESIRRFEVK